MTEALTEFDIIQRFFRVAGLAAVPGQHPGIQLGIGDDCALLTVPAGQQLAMSMDMLNEGIHFPVGAAAERIAHRALAVNLSDLAAMGATPAGFTLGLSLPNADPDWLAAFSRGLRDMAQCHACPLMGGDITGSADGRIGITIQVHGLISTGSALLRSGARPGDRVMVSGRLGNAAAALPMIQGQPGSTSEPDRIQLENSYFSPEPRLDLGRRLVGRASAAIDISDGLLADLRHIARASAVRLCLRASDVPVSAVARRVAGHEHALRHALCGGDDYELAFTVPPAACDTVGLLAEELGLQITEIGEVEAGEGVLCLDEQGSPLEMASAGYEHFRS